MAKTQTKEVAVIDFEKFSVAQLPELQGKKEEIKGIIEANPVVDVVDNSTYELAKKSRTSVKSLCTGLEGEQKTVKKRIKEFVLDAVDKEYDTLVLEARSALKERQEPITAWEGKKEQERLQKARLEQERIDGIKNSIKEFGDIWEKAFSLVKFENIEKTKSTFKESIDAINSAIYQEYEVLFTDKVSYLENVLYSKIKTLTEQEEIRLEQIRLAEERKKQEEEAKKIAEAQRVEREKFEAEQKAIAEKQRIAKEQFEKEKTEFEAKQLEAKFQDRCKQLVDLGFVFNEVNAFKKGDVYLNVDDIKLASDDMWLRELEDAKNVKHFSELETSSQYQEVDFEEVKTDEIAQESKLTEGFSSKEQIREFDEEDVHEVATAKTIEKESLFDVSKIENQIWNNIYEEWNLVSDKYPDAFEYLKEFYHSPTKKQ